MSLLHLPLHIIGVVSGGDLTGSTTEFIAPVVADKGHDTEDSGILSRENQHVDRRFAALAADALKEDKTRAQLFAEVELVEDFTDLRLSLDLFLDIFSHIPRVGGGVRLVRQVRHAEGQRFVLDRLIPAREDHAGARIEPLHGEFSGLVEIDKPVGSQTRVVHGVGTARHGEAGEREHKQAGILQIRQIRDLRCRGHGVARLLSAC